MPFSPDPSTRTRSAAIACFIPDYGHLQPLLRIADALGQQGYSVRCYVPEECAPLIQRLPVQATYLDPMDLTQAKSAMAEAFARSVFFNRYSGDAPSNVYFFPEIMAAAGRSAERVRAQLIAQRPDVVIADEKVFVDWYGRMAAAVGAPLIVNNCLGSLAYAQNAYVGTYGITNVPPAAQKAVELAGSAFYHAYRVGYRLGRIRDSREAFVKKREARQAFDAVFPTPIAPDRVLGPISIGSARIETDRLSGMLGAIERTRPVFNPIGFRSRATIPEDLRAWLDAPSSAPVVYVSFGSIVELNQPFVAAVHGGLQRIRARALWRIPSDQRPLLASLPPCETIRIETFVPQPEVLEHPAVRCFLTQGGAWSVQEAWLAGTPMVVIPFFADQPYNASLVQQLGVGLNSGGAK